LAEGSVEEDSPVELAEQSEDDKQHTVSDEIVASCFMSFNLKNFLRDT
jgi:hypothetical protein